MPDTKTATEQMTAALADIRARADAATPGPWRWRGNMDYSDPYLAGGRRLGPDGKPEGMAQDVLGHVPHEVTRAEARRHIDLDSLPPPDVDLEPRDTYDQRYDVAAQAQLEEEIAAYQTDKYGEPLREPRLAFCSDDFYTPARELAVYEVCPQATHREDARVYRADISGIRHPDAEFIAHSRTDITGLLAAVDAVLALAKVYDDGDSLVDPAGAIRAAVGEALGVTDA